MNKGSRVRSALNGLSPSYPLNYVDFCNVSNPSEARMTPFRSFIYSIIELSSSISNCSVFHLPVSIHATSENSDWSNRSDGRVHISMVLLNTGETLAFASFASRISAKRPLRENWTVVYCSFHRDSCKPIQHHAEGTADHILSHHIHSFLSFAQRLKRLILFSPLLECLAPPTPCRRLTLIHMDV